MAKRSSTLSGEVSFKGVESPEMVKWPHAINLFMGAWLLFAPFTLGYQSRALAWSDWICGALILLLSYVSLSRRNVWTPWIVSLIGFWLLLAPLVFWARTSGAYTNDTLVGILVIGFALLAPGVPGERELPGAETPPGWSYNPSAWGQRAPIIGFALLSFFISRYLSAYQLGHIDSVWDPFFGDGTRTILESDVSKAFPISDAGLGAVAYMFEALTGLIGNTRRWRTMPWMVVLFSLQVVPLGVVSIVLVILQPVSVGAWCTLCLLTALIMLVMIPPAVDEVFATLQFLVHTKREGKSVWKAFWSGGSVEASEESSVQPSEEENWIVSATKLPWHLLAAAALGAWLLASPELTQTTGTAAAANHVLGALVTSFAFLAIAEVTRAARYLLLLFALLIALAPFVLAGASGLTVWNNLLISLALIPLSIPKGQVHQQYGFWNRYIV